MDKKKPNIFDATMNALISSIPLEEYKIIYENESSRRFFEFFVLRHTDILNYRSLVVGKYLPATQQAVEQQKADLKRSKFKDLLHMSEDEFREPIDELMRLSYVGLFHKYENFIDKLLEMVYEMNNDSYKDKEDVANFFEQKFGFKMRDWKNNKHLWRISWICNCVKHRDGYPVKESPPEEYKDAIKDQRMRLTSSQFKEDVEFILGYIKLICQNFPMVATLKGLTELNEKSIHDEEFTASQRLVLESVKFNASNYFGLLTVNRHQD